jgi:hypothetical protein
MKADELMKNARVFLCNTNRKQGKAWEEDLTFFERMMHREKHALAWTFFKFPKHMGEVGKGDLIIMWAKNVGAIGLGEAKGPVEIYGPKDKRFYSGFDRNPPPSDEYRIPVKWVAWVGEDGAYPWYGYGMNFTFARADNDTWRAKARDAIQYLLDRK